MVDLHEICIEGSVLEWIVRVVWKLALIPTGGGPPPAPLHCLTYGEGVPAPRPFEWFDLRGGVPRRVD